MATQLTAAGMTLVSSVKAPDCEANGSNNRKQPDSSVSVSDPSESHLSHLLLTFSWKYQPPQLLPLDFSVDPESLHEWWSVGAEALVSVLLS